MIKDQARSISNLLLAGIVLTIAASALVLADIRYGGPIFRKYALQDELIGDILPPPMYEVEAYLEASLILTNPNEMNEHITNLTQLEKDYRTRKVYWQASALTPEEMATLQDADTHADAVWDAVDKRYLPAARAHDTATMQRVHDAEMEPAYKAQHKAILRLVDQSNGFSEAQHSHDGWVVGLMLAGIALLAGLVMGALWWAARAVRLRVTAPLGTMADTMQRMASGDWEMAIDGQNRNDELGIMARSTEVFRDAGMAKASADVEQKRVVDQLSHALSRLAGQDLTIRINDTFPPAYEDLRHDFNKAVGELATALGTVLSGTNGLMVSINEIRTASENLARRNDLQAASLEKTAGSIGEVSTSMRQSAHSAQNAKKASAVAHGQASEGGEVVTRAVNAMAMIKTSSQEISQIINVIDGIAFQTNLLALNAGVEAARAGDAGKGFAVVASEVRALAQRSADAAQNIKELITTSTLQVEDGVALVDETGAKLREIVEQVAEIDTLIGDIARSSESQAVNVVQVNDAVHEMDRMTQQNAAMVEQSSAATRTLALEAERLTDLVGGFRTPDGHMQGGAGYRGPISFAA